MNLFINETHIFLSAEKADIRENEYDYVWENTQAMLSPTQLTGKVLLKFPSDELLRECLFGVIEQKYHHLNQLTCLLEGLKDTKKRLLEGFKIIEAAGGLVTKEDKILMIYRLKKWDLPKGKVEEGEKRRETAVREVEEECNLKVELIRKLCTTWHHYRMGEIQVLKQTKWYQMRCLDDRRMKPQFEEDIEEIRWMSREEVQKALLESYPTIRFVVEHYV